MAWTATTFKAEYAEFEPAADALVTAKLAAAARRVDARVYGDRYDDAVGLVAADLLARSPFARDMKLIAKDDSTAYSRQATELARMAAGGPWLTGQAADGTFPTGCP